MGAQRKALSANEKTAGEPFRLHFDDVHDGDLCVDQLRTWFKEEFEKVLEARRISVVSVQHWFDFGKFFYFTPGSWAAKFGAEPSSAVFGSKHHVEQWRDKRMVWKGTVVVWNNRMTGGSRCPTHGRRSKGAAPGQ